ncbi:LOW QUALITY PROTEIN: hypothetical protein PHMEG_0009745 [Phytophthora megakarya]|uniref:CCHC-type domain-containing protein n=1 Tax=Phytophthora megakarya TaxID=4795 RepID=A0A225WFG7_9STRA|nr:LOW QUALITY PROTEIN: hypothetical protein PHMEG_0009745 [Phytophthora megakarya]
MPQRPVGAAKYQKAHARLSQIQHLGTAQHATPTAPPVQQPPPIAKQAQGQTEQQQQQPADYPDVRQKKLAIRPIRKKEVYVGLGSGFLEWGRRFEGQVFLAQTSRGFLWPEEVKIDLSTSSCLGVSDVHPVFVMDRMLGTFRTTITPALATKHLMVRKDPKRSWTERYLYQLAVLEAYVAGLKHVVVGIDEPQNCANGEGKWTKDDHLQLVEELAHFAQTRVNDATKGKRFNQECESRTNDVLKRRCYGCGEVGHLKAVCPEGGKAADFTLAVSDLTDEANETWNLDSGPSSHLVKILSWLEDTEVCDDLCSQPNGEQLQLSLKGSLIPQITAGGMKKTVKLTDVHYEENVVHNLISYGKLGKRDCTLGNGDGRRVVITSDVFDVHLQRNVLVDHGKVNNKGKAVTNVIMAALEKEAAESGEMAPDAQWDGLVEFHRRLGLLNYDAVERLAKLWHRTD